MKSIGLLGLTGVGKTTVAKRLRDAHGFTIISTGIVCRDISRILYGNEDKTNLMKLTDALRTLDDAIFLKAALAKNVGLQNLNVVIDALRFRGDYGYASDNQFLLIRVQASISNRKVWLFRRGQQYDFDKDQAHDSEQALLTADVHFEIENSGTIEDLCEKVDEIVQKTSVPNV